MNSVLQNYKTLAIAAVVAVVALLSSVVIVPETHQAVARAMSRLEVWVGWSEIQVRISSLVGMRAMGVT